MKHLFLTLLCFAFASCRQPPPPEAVQPYEPDYTPLRVAITTNSTDVSYWISDYSMSHEAIRAYLAETFTRYGADHIWIVPDSATTFETVAQLLGNLKSIGYTHCAVIANQRRVVDAFSANRIEVDPSRIEAIEWSIPPTNSK